MKKNVEKSKSRVSEVQILTTEKLRQVTGGQGQLPVPPIPPIKCW